MSKIVIMESLGISAEELAARKAPFEAATRYSRGAIVGSKFVQLLGESATPDEAVEHLLKALGE